MVVTRSNRDTMTPGKPPGAAAMASSSPAAAAAPAAAAPAKAKKKAVDWKEIACKALGGGVPGAVAMVLQVFLLMWLRTVVNYQMKFGGTLMGTVRVLYAEGGIPRFYAGMWAALIQSPLARFGDTAANAGILALLAESSLPVPVQTVFASVGAALWRIVITPLDTVKTTLQVGGTAAYGDLLKRVASQGPLILWAGALGNLVATFVGHYPWFATNNTLEVALPGAKATSKTLILLRRASIGLCSSLVSDLVSNSMRVLKTHVQTADVPIGYVDAVRVIVQTRGLNGFFFAGLTTKMIANGISSIIFSVLWKMMMDKHKQQTSSTDSKKKKQQTPKKTK